VTASTIAAQFEQRAARAEAAVAERRGGQKIIVQVGSATCEHAAGSREVF
jgi:hypothetical protein